MEKITLTITWVWTRKDSRDRNRGKKSKIHRGIEPKHSYFASEPLTISPRRAVETGRLQGEDSPTKFFEKKTMKLWTPLPRKYAALSSWKVYRPPFSDTLFHMALFSFRSRTSSPSASLVRLIHPRATMKLCEFPFNHRFSCFVPSDFPGFFSLVSQHLHYLLETLER